MIHSFSSLATALCFLVHFFLPIWGQSVHGTQKISNLQGGFGLSLPMDANFGSATTFVADFDNNGITDIVVGAPTDGNGALYFVTLDSAGMALTTTRLSSPTVTGVTTGANFGRSVTQIGDLDGDGDIDIAVGAPGTTTPRVFIIFLTPTGAYQGQTSFTDTFSSFGSSIAYLGDFDLDGLPEIAVGSPSSGEGLVNIISLNPTGTMNGGPIRLDSFSTPNIPAVTGDNLGISLANVGDVNGDGVVDLAVGATGHQTDDGGVYLLFLQSSGPIFDFPSSQLFANGEPGVPANFSLNDNDQFGFSIVPLYDINNDGIVDFAVGAIGDDDGCGGQPCNRGAVYVFPLDRGGAILDILQISSASGGFTGLLGTDNRFGAALASGHDINGDSVPDLIVGVPNDDDGASNSGAVYVLFLGHCGDGIVSGTETCEDGNNADGDGCSSCNTEIGFDCSSGTCNAICGDSLIRGNEQCDDGNIENGDGCSSECIMVDSAATFSGGTIAGIVVGVLFGFCCLILVFIGILAAVKIQQKHKERSLNLQVIMRNDIDVLESLTIGEVLGTGQFGTVYKGDWNGIAVAAKSLIGESVEDFVNELKILKGVKHPNVISFFGINYQNDTYFMVTEFMNRGDLLGLLHHEANISTKDLVSIASQIAHGMQYLHEKNIVHRDLACRNILISEAEKKFVAKVADFGLSRIITNYYKSNTRELPVRWTAPEAIEFMKFNQASDVWSFSIVLWEIFARGGVPYPGFSNEEVLKKLNSGYRMKSPRGTPGAVERLMVQCWSQDPNDRPSFSKAAQQLDEISPEELTVSYHSSKPSAYTNADTISIGSGQGSKLQKKGFRPPPMSPAPLMPTQELLKLEKGELVRMLESAHQTILALRTENQQVLYNNQ